MGTGGGIILFNLEHGLKMYDAISERISAYEQEIQNRLERLATPGSKDKTAPALPNRERMKAIKRRNQEQRRQSLFRRVGMDLTTMDGIGVETAAVVISE